MKSRMASLLVGAISLLAVTSGGSQANPSREKKLESLLADLVGRCQLDMQIAVHKGTVRLDKVIKNTANKMPRSNDRQAALKLSDDEKDIVAEATKAMDILKAAAVAFPEIFDQMREDMKRVQSRLANGDVGLETQAIEQDIIDTLKDMMPRK
jgi:hypothetical protein